MNHDTDHLDENEEALNVSDEALEAAASLNNPLFAAFSSANKAQC